MNENQGFLHQFLLNYHNKIPYDVIGIILFAVAVVLMVVGILLIQFHRKKPLQSSKGKTPFGVANKQSIPDIADSGANIRKEGSHDSSSSVKRRDSRIGSPQPVQQPPMQQPPMQQPVMQSQPDVVPMPPVNAPMANASMEPYHDSMPVFAKKGTAENAEPNSSQHVLGQHNHVMDIYFEYEDAYEIKM